MMKNMKMRNVETITPTSLALKPFILYIITKIVRFNSFPQASITRNATLDKGFLAWISDIPSSRRDVWNSG